ncbi:HAD family phosphatase [uncultured Arthrobacter sp.]|uniref:HAD family hydrolase n=1 Tax=uncultured Arthrobacter sp. TaxID=114050 RepID=UPI00260E27A1|nr:HAD family phosphatase [uncultured Arthrobacter sp.]
MVTPLSYTAVPSEYGYHPEPDASPEPALQAVLWDMDGTIVDTEPYWIEAEYRLVAAHGGSWSEEQAEGLVGQALTFSAGVLQAAGVELSVREIIDTLTEQVTARVRESVPWRPGARELLLALRERGIPCAMVTMSEQQLALEVARHLPDGTFELLVTGDRVAKGKPHPEAYETAFDELSKTRPLRKECVVAIEDSLPGVTSARASGVVTLGVPHFVALPPDSSDHQWPSLADRSVQDLENLVQSHAGHPEDGRVTA